MPAKQSAETKHALHLVTVEGLAVYEAAARAGIFASTLYRALKAKSLKPKAKKKLA